MTALKRRKTHSVSDINKLADKLADKPYGQIAHKKDQLTRTTISLPSSLLFRLEDMAIKNKRTNKELKSVSALIRHYIETNIDS